MSKTSHRLHWKVFPTLTKKDREDGVKRPWPAAYIVHRGRMELFAQVRGNEAYDRRLARSGKHGPLSIYVCRLDLRQWLRLEKMFVDFYAAKQGLAKFLEKHPEMLG